MFSVSAIVLTIAVILQGYERFYTAWNKSLKYARPEVLTAVTTKCQNSILPLSLGLISKPCKQKAGPCSVYSLNLKLIDWLVGRTFFGNVGKLLQN
jgi:Na+/H+-dicarboxylate symporter